MSQQSQPQDPHAVWDPEYSEEVEILITNTDSHRGEVEGCGFIHFNGVTVNGSHPGRPIYGHASVIDGKVADLVLTQS